MRRTILVLMLGLALAAPAVAGCGGDDDEGATDTDTATETDTGAAAAPGDTLLGSVGPGFDISLTTEDGQDVTTLALGSYTIAVNDQSDIHNFHLTGAGVETSTTVSEVTEVSWPVELQAGMYEYQCDPHASSMNGSFEVTG